MGGCWAPPPPTGIGLRKHYERKIFSDIFNLFQFGLESPLGWILANTDCGNLPGGILHGGILPNGILLVEILPGEILPGGILNWRDFGGNLNRRKFELAGKLRYTKLNILWTWEEIVNIIIITHLRVIKMPWQFFYAWQWYTRKNIDDTNILKTRSTRIQN